uniref:Glucose-methanol-choline oxidoreductase N-terminal domain-containing protein n=1 Tax=Compsopogon caeruleus TaxID=31354 RepID=A0A7S1XBS3_9RHOD
MSVMLYHRGDVRDYERWEEMGARGWGPADVLPYFRKSENQATKTDSVYHGKTGPLRVSDLAHVNPMSKAFMEAAAEVGLPTNDDFNDWARPQEGIGPFQVTQSDGMRVTPATSYLRAAQGRSNLKVRTRARVERVNFEMGPDGKPFASGVTYVDKNERRVTIRAHREVILAAGSVVSPQLLMLSGVGPGSHLQDHGISVVSDLAGVGENFQDQPATALCFRSPSPLDDKKKDRIFYSEKTGKSLVNLLDYIVRGKGPLTCPLCEVGGFVKTNPDHESCDLQLRFVPFSSEPDPYSSLGEFAEAGDYLTNRSNRPAGFTIQSVVARPRSRGKVLIPQSHSFCLGHPLMHHVYPDVVYLGHRFCYDRRTRGIPPGFKQTGSMTKLI